MVRKQAWLVTINTNSVNEKLIGPLNRVWKYILENMVQFTFGTPGTRIVSVKENHAFERGAKFHRIHLHSKLEITSNNDNLANLDYSGIKKFINRQLSQIPNFGGVMFNAKLIPNYNNIVKIQEYIEKDQLPIPEDDEEFRII